MSSQSFEMALARLYTDPEFRRSFLENPEQALENCDLTSEELKDLLAIDRTGLIMAAHSFFNKRKKRAGKLQSSKN